MRKQRFIWLLCLPLFYGQAFGSQAIITKVEEPFSAHPLTLVDTNGKTQTVLDFSGKTTVIHFWATWCPPCRQELPSLEIFQSRYKDAVHVITVAADNRQSVKQFLSNTPLRLPVLIDQYGASLHDYKINFFPSSVIINRNGKVTTMIKGRVDWTTYVVD